MSAFFWKDHRLAWVPVLALLACALAMLVGDYVWRVSSVPGSAILGFFALVVGLSLGVTIRDWMKRKSTH